MGGVDTVVPDDCGDVGDILIETRSTSSNHSSAFERAVVGVDSPDEVLISFMSGKRDFQIKNRVFQIRLFFR